MRGEQHLTKRSQYLRVYRQGRAWAGGVVVVKAAPNGLEIPRYGLSVTRKVGGAVVRNRVKRLLRENLKDLKLRPGWDIVFIARSSAASADYHAVSRSVKRMLNKADLIVNGGEGFGGA